MDNQQSLPQLNLSNDQRNIIAAHIAHDAQQLLSARVNPGKESDFIYHFQYCRGRMDAFTALMTYDNQES